jgi:hypothetical protein
MQGLGEKTRHPGQTVKVCTILGTIFGPQTSHVWSTNNRYCTSWCRNLAVLWRGTDCSAVPLWKILLFLRDPSRDSVGPPHSCATHPSTHVREGPAQVDCYSARNFVYIWSVLPVYTSKSLWDRNSSTLICDRPQRDRPAACVVIAQQYSSASFV